VSEAEETLAFQMKAIELAFEREHKFHPTRKWRFDFAFPRKRIAVEIEGGIWMKKSRHTSSKGYLSDMEKYNAANKLGWRVLRFTPQEVKSGYALQEIEEAIAV
jgi:very-short-patch-repair endonuclease